ncbi:hypothetical protein ES702_02175 [subsurface metagenome]
MGLKEAYMIKDSWSHSTKTLSVEAKVGESLLIKQLLVSHDDLKGFCECFIDRLSIGYWFIGWSAGCHLEMCAVTDVLPNLFERLQQLGKFNGYPVAEGETFSIKNAVNDLDIRASIVYEVHEAGDITSDMPGGSKSDEYMFINYGTNNALILEGEYGAINHSRNPSEYPAFPFGEVVPPGHEIDIHGVLIATWRGLVDDSSASMRYLKLVHDRKVLFNEDRRGIWLPQGSGHLTWGSIRQTNCDIKLFPVPVTFKAGDELNMTMSCGSADGDVTAKDTMLAVVQTVRKVSA